MGMDGAEQPRLDGLRPAAIHLSDAEVDTARFAFHRARPAYSAKRVLYVTQGIAFALLIAFVLLAFDFAPGPAFGIAHIGALILFAGAILVRFLAASSSKRILTRIAEPAHWPIYSILCPVYREANIVPDLVAALARIDYPRDRLDVKLLVEADDVDTLAAALAVSEPEHIEVVVIPAAVPRTKPKALNAGLARAHGEYVVVYDAEDRPHPQQLRAALAAFEDGDARLACVQAPLVIDNQDDSWIANQFAAEYAIQFREILPWLAKLGLPLPLGGSSNHFRTDILRAAGGWDAWNVTEDADLGYRLARDGYASTVIGPPTGEEAPVTLKAWIAQRTRWIKGHMQTWLVLMRDPMRTASDMGLPAFVTMQLILGGGIAAAFAHGPLAFMLVLAALLPYDLLTTADFILAICGYCTAMFAAFMASGVSGQLSHARAALTMPLYWPLSTIAALRALWELTFQPHHWAKTTHGVSRRRWIAQPATTA